jgi:hypothetical protein
MPVEILGGPPRTEDIAPIDEGSMYFTNLFFGMKNYKK